MNVMFIKKDCEDKDGWIDGTNLPVEQKLKVGEKVVFYAERRREGVWDGKYIREDGTNLPWGILGILSSSDGWMMVERELKDLI